MSGSSLARRVAAVAKEGSAGSFSGRGWGTMLATTRRVLVALLFVLAVLAGGVASYGWR